MNGFLMHREMFCKILGIICILLSVSGIGVRNNRRLHRQLMELRQLLQLMQLLQGEIQYQCATLPEAFIQCGERLQGECGVWIRRLGERLFEYEGLSFRQIWEQELDELRGRTMLSKECLMNLKQLGGQLAYADRNTQLHGLQLCCTRLEEEEGRLFKELPGKRRTGMGLIILTGCFLVILLV